MAGLTVCVSPEVSQDRCGARKVPGFDQDRYRDAESPWGLRAP